MDLSLQAIQKKNIEQVTSELGKQLEDNTEGEAFMYCAIVVHHLKMDEDHQVITENHFDGHSESGSVYTLDADTSSELTCDDLELYDLPVNS